MPHQRGLSLSLAAACVLVAATVSAQDFAPPPVEIGVTGSGLIVASFEGGAAGRGGAGAAVILNLSRRVRIDVLGDAVLPGDASAFSGLYQIQARFPVRTAPDLLQTFSVTVGAAGLYSRDRFREIRIPRADGSILVRPAFTRTRVTPPRLATAGVAHHRVLSARTSLILATQVLFGEGGIALRGSAGIAFGVRRYR
jgi:hypothetical protein